MRNSVFVYVLTMLVLSISAKEGYIEQIVKSRHGNSVLIRNNFNANADKVLIIEKECTVDGQQEIMTSLENKIYPWRLTYSFSGNISKSKYIVRQEDFAKNEEGVKYLSKYTKDGFKKYREMQLQELIKQKKNVSSVNRKEYEKRIDDVRKMTYIYSPIYYKKFRTVKETLPVVEQKLKRIFGGEWVFLRQSGFYLNSSDYILGASDEAYHPESHQYWARKIDGQRLYGLMKVDFDLVTGQINYLLCDKKIATPPELNESLLKPTISKEKALEVTTQYAEQHCLEFFDKMYVKKNVDLLLKSTSGLSKLAPEQRTDLISEFFEIALETISTAYVYQETPLPGYKEYDLEQYASEDRLLYCCPVKFKVKGPAWKGFSFLVYIDAHKATVVGMEQVFESTYLPLTSYMFDQKYGKGAKKIEETSGKSDENMLQLCEELKKYQ